MTPREEVLKAIREAEVCPAPMAAHAQILNVLMLDIRDLLSQAIVRAEIIDDVRVPEAATAATAPPGQ